MANAVKKYITSRHFRLQHDQPSDFVHSEVCESPFPYAVGITCVSIYTFTMAFYSGFSSPYGEKILIWLTYWSYFILTGRFLVTACNVWVHVLRQRNKTPSQGSAKSPEKEQEVSEMPVLYKVQWVLQNVSSCSALIVTSLYWFIMYTASKPESPRSINSHAVNSALVLGDLLLSRAPWRIHHFFHTSLFITAYVLFTVVYWAAGGRNDKGKPYVYALLDYSEHPGRASGIFFAVSLLGAPLLQCFLFSVYRLKVKLWRKCFGQRKESENENGDGPSLGGSKCSLKDKRSKDGSICLEEGKEKNGSYEGRSYTLASNREEDITIDVDLDFEMDDLVCYRPHLRSDTSQVSCTESTKALID